MQDELETEHVDRQRRGSTDASLLRQTTGTLSVGGVRKLVN